MAAKHENVEYDGYDNKAGGYICRLAIHMTTSVCAEIEQEKAMSSILYVLQIDYIDIVILTTYLYIEAQQLQGEQLQHICIIQMHA